MLTCTSPLSAEIHNQSVTEHFHFNSTSTLTVKIVEGNIKIPMPAKSKQKHLFPNSYYTCLPAKKGLLNCVEQVNSIYVGDKSGFWELAWLLGHDQRKFN